MKYLRLAQPTLTAMFFAAALFGGASMATRAQGRDPFMTSPAARNKAKSGGARPTTAKSKPAAPATPTPVAPPALQARVDNYRQVKARALQSGDDVPKPTTALLINELSITGIFRTPRGHAAMVQATALKLSFIVYPGEAFYDGQLVAIDEDRLVFRRNVAFSDGKRETKVEERLLSQPSNDAVLSTRADNSAPPAATPETTNPSSDADAANAANNHNGKP